MGYLMVLDVKRKGKWAKIVDGKSTKSFAVWCKMVDRCRVDGSYQNMRPTYIGCFMSEEFKDFQIFADWYTNQIGYGVSGYEVDKDILVKGNKEYSKDFCVLVPHQLNKFLTFTNSRRGSYPLGVSIMRDGKFQARISIDANQIHLGTYSTPEQAEEIYRRAKEAEALRWVERLTNEEFLIDSRVIKALKNWRL